MNLKDYIRSIPNYPKKGILFRDITTLIKDEKAFAETIDQFIEKSKGDTGWINGGFFVLNKKIFNYLKNDQTVFEKGPLEKLSTDRQLAAFKHEGFWQPMDTLREKEFLEEQWNSNKAPWKIW